MEKKRLSKLAARTGERGARKSAFRRLNIVIFQTRFVKKPPCFVLSYGTGIVSRIIIRISIESTRDVPTRLVSPGHLVIPASPAAPTPNASANRESSLSGPRSAGVP